nr:DUF4214 domain-containing protein [Massilia sp. YIM B04103]
MWKNISMSTISSSIYLNKFSAPVFDQLGENSCVANAVCQAIRLQSREYHQDTGELARNQIYYEYRAANGKAAIDGGANVNLMLKLATQVGISTQAAAAPYDGNVIDHNQNGIVDTTSAVYQAPTASAKASAASQKVTGYSSYANWLIFKDGVFGNLLPSELSNGEVQVNKALQQAQINSVLDKELMHGKAVILGGEIPNWLGYMGAKPFSQQTTFTNQEKYGDHAFLVVGRDDHLNGGSYIIENSWGEGWGDKGYAAIPYNFLYTGIKLRTVDVVDGFKGVDTAWTTERGQVAMLYSTVLDRAVEHNGLEFWANALKNGKTVQQVSNDLASSAEAQSKYGSISNADYINTLYLNTLGRSVDAVGKQFWLNKMSAEGMSRGDVAYHLMTSTANTNGVGSAPTWAEHDFLINRATVSENFGLTYQIEGHDAVGTRALDLVTSDASSVQVALTGIQHDMGWM